MTDFSKSEICSRVKRRSPIPTSDRFVISMPSSSGCRNFFRASPLIDPSSMMDNGFLKPPLSLLLWISLPVLFLLSRFRPKLRRVLLVAAAGFMGMVLETILILYYQVKHGVLYQDIGLLLMSFMAGLAAGRNS